MKTEIERLRREQETLRASAAELQAMFAAMSDAVFVFDAEGRYVKVSPPAPTLVYRPSPSVELEGRTLHEIVPTPVADAIVAHIHMALTERRVVSMDYTLTIGGRDVPFAVNISPMSHDKVVLVARDVTEQRRAKEVLEAVNERLERQVAERTAELLAAKDAADAANRAKSDFLASMSHELRTPLNAILGYAQLLDRSRALTSQDRDGLRVIRRSGEHLLTLINDVLDLAKIEAGKLDLVPKDMNLSQTLNTVSSICRVRADQKGITFHEVSPPDLPAVVADQKRLMEVLLNLVGNAIKFTARGGVRLLTHMLEDESSSRGDGAVRTFRFRVEDSGCGIAPVHLGQIFEPFERVGTAGTEGTGLGLAITRRIVDAMGGRVEVESTLGEGSTFTVTVRLPLAKAVAPPAVSPSLEQIVGYEGDRRTVLVVDDVADNRAVLRDFLSPIGFDVVEAEDGEQALSMAAAYKPALIFMDLAMPVMNGYEASRRLREIPDFATTTIIATSASISEPEASNSTSAGCNDFLPKPIHDEELFEKLERHLGLAWVRTASATRDTTLRPPPGDAAALQPPPPQRVDALFQLAKGGRLSQILRELQRLEHEAPQSVAWIEYLRERVLRFDLRGVREFLRASRA